MFLCAGCLIAASPEKDKDRDGEGGVCRVSGMRCMQAGHASVPPMSRCQCSHVFCLFLLFFLGILSPSTHIFYSTPPKQNTTSLANEKDPRDKEAQHTVVACITLLQYWVNCFILLFTILFTSTYKHHQLCKFPLLCLFQACPAQLMIGGKDAQACRTQHAQHVA